MQPAKLAGKVIHEGKWFVSPARRTFLLGQDVADASATIRNHGEQIRALTDEVRALRAENAVMAARLEAIAVRAAAEVTGELNRRLGFLEGRMGVTQQPPS